MKIDHGSTCMRIKTANKISLCSYMYKKDLSLHCFNKDHTFKSLQWSILYRWLYNMDSVQKIDYMTKKIFEYVIKVFRLLRKTFLLFYCFFFIIIKVFRLNGRPYCYSSVSFSLLLLELFDSVEKTYCYCVFLLFFFFLDKCWSNILSKR